MVCDVLTFCTIVNIVCPPNTVTIKQVFQVDYLGCVPFRDAIDEHTPPLNMSDMFVTWDVFQLERSLLNIVVSLNLLDVVVT